MSAFRSRARARSSSRRRSQPSCPRDGKLLVLVNGAYGTRMVQMARVMGRAVEALEWREDEQVDPRALEQRLADDTGITHVAVVHCETTSGILNPIEAVAEVVGHAGRGAGHRCNERLRCSSARCAQDRVRGRVRIVQQVPARGCPAWASP